MKYLIVALVAASIGFMVAKVGHKKIIDQTSKGLVKASKVIDSANRKIP